VNEYAVLRWPARHGETRGAIAKDRRGMAKDRRGMAKDRRGMTKDRRGMAKDTAPSRRTGAAWLWRRRFRGGASALAMP